MSTIEPLTVLCDYELTPPTKSNIVLVFVHGWLLSRCYWEPLIQQLSPHYQCLSYDLRGFGRSAAGAPWHPNPASAAIPNNYSLASHATDLQALLTQLNIEQAWLVGHSLGGSIALWAADLDVERIQGVICINAGGGIYLEQEFAKFRQAGQQMLTFRPHWLRYVPLIDQAFRQMAVTQPIASHWGKQRLIDFLDADLEAARESLLTSTTKAEVHQLPQIVARLKQPAYFIAGATDTIMEPRYVKHLASFHRSFDEWGENVLNLSTCGHLAMLEQTDAVAQYIQSIVQGIAVPACI
ncbi:alpha/beta hydrolase [filamentous cyanobacterium LEGE 11480]|uniref:Alpha/beta hydrolase n=1 Tax=Romeriopsis navalis LEGE 11480 TaxID=2777977 RepID=A0A928VUI8_9CYAN|nr:alpha/beta hydrolase [Romeriopsis navalis]MBE9032830.1 alpha/beta hydrolase [Romeriopsis navalis LEGE 11480]